MLGAGFFQDVTGVKRAKQKTYDQATLLAEADDDEVHDEVYTAEGEGMNEDDMVEVLMQEGDTDATFITDFENPATDLIQGDEELAAAFNTYSEARRRLSEKVRFRGFWPQCLQVVSTRALQRAVSRESFRRVTHLRESHWSRGFSPHDAEFATSWDTGKLSALNATHDRHSLVPQHRPPLSVPIRLCRWNFCTCPKLVVKP